MIFETFYSITIFLARHFFKIQSINRFKVYNRKYSVLGSKRVFKENLDFLMYFFLFIIVNFVVLVVYFCLNIIFFLFKVFISTTRHFKNVEKLYAITVLGHTQDPNRGTMTLMISQATCVPISFIRLLGSTIRPGNCSVLIQSMI